MENKETKRQRRGDVIILLILLLLTPRGVVAINPEIEYVVIINIDALRDDVLINSLENIPYIHKLLNHGMYYDDTTTIFPSITMAAQASIFTGSNPGSHMVAGHNWFDKNNQEYRHYSVGVWYDDIIWSEGQANEDLSNDIETIYEAAHNSNLNSTVIFNQYSRLNEGTTNWIKPGLQELWYTIITKEYHKTDSNSMNHSLNELDKFPHNPQVLTIYLPGNDENSHDNGPSDQPRYITTYTDTEIGKLINKLENLHILNRTLIVITSDHGQTAVTDDGEHAISRNRLEEVLEDSPSLSTLNYTTDWSGSCFDTCTICIGEPTCTMVPVCRCAVVATNGGMTQIYVSRYGGSWGEPSKDDVLAVAGEFHSKNYTKAVLIRYDGSDGYELYDGDNSTEDISSLESTYYPDAVARINGLDSNRSGDIILLANYIGGYYFEDNPKKGVHGNLNWEDTYVPLVFSHPQLAGCTASGARNIDIAPTIADLMGFSMSADGNSLADEIRSCFTRNPGELLSISVTVHNNGLNESGETWLEVYDGDPDCGWEKRLLIICFKGGDCNE